MQPSIRAYSNFVIWYFYCFTVAIGVNSGKLTEAENQERLETCGKLAREENEYGGMFITDETSSPFSKYLIALSSRHVVVDPKSNLLGFTYSKENCKDNIQNFTIESNQTWLGKVNYKNEAFYIGSCKHDTPRGFVIVEHTLKHPHIYVPHCISNTPLSNDSDVDIFTTWNVTGLSVEFIISKVYFCKNQTDGMCTEQLVIDYGGPVLDPVYENATFVGHALTHDRESIYIVPIFPYLKQLCEVTGICEPSLDENSLGASSLLPSSFSKSKLSFVDPEEPVIHVNFPVVESSPGGPIITSFHTFMNSEVIDGGEADDEELDVLIEEIESSGEDSEDESVVHFNLDPETNDVPNFQINPIQKEKVLVLFNSEDLNPEPDYEPFVMSVVPEQKVGAPAPEASTIVRAEPYSAVIIPLPEQNKANGTRSEFSTPEELLIAFLIMLSLTFFVLMCLYGCVDYEGKRYYWKPYLGEIPV